MKPLVCFYCEGRETKIAVLSKVKDRISILKTESVGLVTHSPGLGADSGSIDMTGFGGDLALDGMSDIQTTNKDDGGFDYSMVSNSLLGVKLDNAEIIPILTEPALNYHSYDGIIEKDPQKQIELVVNDINKSKGLAISKDKAAYIQSADNSLIAAYLDANVPCIDLINGFARYNGRRYYKIPTLKSAEFSLSYFVAKTTKLFPEDFTLILYTGKEYSKLIFLEGQKLKHMGTVLDIGTQNLNTYDVYFSKVLLEMENGGIPRLDNIILCGEDNSENLMLSFYGTFPEANVSSVKFDDFDISELKEEEKNSLHAFSIPIAAAVDYFDSLEKVHAGLTILPNFIKENQKFLQFGWHSYAMLPILFAATLFFTVQILNKTRESSEMESQIKKLTDLQIQNQTIIEEINGLSSRISSFDQTTALLDSASAGTDIWEKMMVNVSNFMEREGSFWLTRLSGSSSTIIEVEGFSLSRKALINFAEYSNSSMLQNMIYEPLREQNTYKFKLNFDFKNQPGVR